MWLLIVITGWLYGITWLPLKVKWPGSKRVNMSLLWYCIIQYTCLSTYQRQNCDKSAARRRLIDCVGVKVSLCQVKPLFLTSLSHFTQGSQDFTCNSMVELGYSRVGQQWAYSSIFVMTSCFLILLNQYGICHNLVQKDIFLQLPTTDLDELTWLGNWRVC